MQYSELEREMVGSPLKNTTNDHQYASQSKESPLRSPQSSGLKARHLVKSGSMKSNGSIQNKYSPSPAKKQAENRERSREGQLYRSNTGGVGGEYKSPSRHNNFSSGKKHPKVNVTPYGKPIEIIKGK